MVSQTGIEPSEPPRHARAIEVADDVAVTGNGKLSLEGDVVSQSASVARGCVAVGSASENLSSVLQGLEDELVPEQVRPFPAAQAGT